MQRRVLQTKHLAMTVGELLSVLETVPRHTQIHLAFDNCTNLFAVLLEAGRYGRPGKVILSALEEDDPDQDEEDAA